MLNCIKLYSIKRLYQAVVIAMLILKRLKHYRVETELLSTLQLKALAVLNYKWRLNLLTPCVNIYPFKNSMDHSMESLYGP